MTLTPITRAELDRARHHGHIGVHWVAVCRHCRQWRWQWQEEDVVDPCVRDSHIWTTRQVYSRLAMADGATTAEYVEVVEWDQKEVDHIDTTRVTVSLPADVAEALHRAHLAAGGYGQKTRIVTEAVVAHPEVREQLAKIREVEKNL